MIEPRSWSDGHAIEVVVDSGRLSLPVGVHALWKGATIQDCSCSKSSKTYRLAKPDGVLYCKIGPPGLLEREWSMNHFLASFGLGPEVVHYHQGVDRSYLVTAALDGEEGVSKANLRSPERLAWTLGTSLLRLHGLAPALCPFPNRSAEMLELARHNQSNGVFADYLVPEGIDLGSKRFTRLFGLSHTDSVIHGDYCLPNILLKGFELVGFLDLGNGGYGDSHYDLFWGLWTLEFNLKTTRYNEVFLEAYGRDRVDPDRIEFNRLLSGFMD